VFEIGDNFLEPFPVLDGFCAFAEAGMVEVHSGLCGELGDISGIEIVDAVECVDYAFVGNAFEHCRRRRKGRAKTQKYG